jgi:formyltetrahydrofolate synthetase
LFRILGAFQQRAFGSSTLIAMKIAKKLENRATVFTQSGSGRELPLSEFIAVKPPLEFRFPEAALRH